MKKIFLLLFVVFTIFLFTCKDLFASESMAKMKGFEISNLDYIWDEEDDITLSTDYYYGMSGLWYGFYKSVANESNGTKTAYYFLFLDGYVASSGKYKANYFRNKFLSYEIQFTTSQSSNIVSYTESSNSQTTNSSTCSFSCSGSFDSSGKVGAVSNIGFSYGASTTYSTVNLTVDMKNNNCNVYKNFSFDYNFLNWTNGSMVSPNIGKVNRKAHCIFAIQNYNGYDDYELNVILRASIFKDATWPRKNFTYDISRTFSIKS